MSVPILIQTGDLENTFRALKNQNPQYLSQQQVPYHPDYKSIPNQNYAPTTSVNTSLGMTKSAASMGNAGTIYTQPQFFSPVHTPINWQIPSKRLEEYQWARFFYKNEPKVASAIDFYAYFPMNGWTHECKDPDIKKYFDNMRTRLKLHKWTEYISHEVHLIGDCFVLQEISCEICGGTGRVGDGICEHEEGTVRRIVILNPDFVEVFSSPINPEPLIVFRPDETLINMVLRKEPGHEKLDPKVAKLISSGQPIQLDNRNIAHLKYGDAAYETYGTGMVRRLFPILSYKTKLMVAQWIVAERLIIPIKIVKVGSDSRPAGPADIAAVQQQLAQTTNDPNLTIITHHAFELDFFGASGKVLTLSNEFELINQEILDGLMINNALLNGEGPSFQTAAVGIEAMIERLETFRKSISEWIEEHIYLPEAVRQGFIEEDEATGEIEYIYPKIKWNTMHLRDKNQDRTFAIQLYEKGILSAQTLLEEFGYDPDVEIERKRFDAVQLMALGQDQQGAGGAGGIGGGGALPPMGGMGDMGGAPGEAPIVPGAGGGMGGGDMGGGGMGGGGGGGGAPGPMASSSRTSLTADVANPNAFGGKVLKKKSREKVQREQSQIYQEKQKSQQQFTDQGDGSMRDEKGRIVFTKIERQLFQRLAQSLQDGIIKYSIVPQFRISVGTKEYPVDFAVPSLKIAIEADGEDFHTMPKQQESDKRRDASLHQMGWTVIRFWDRDIEKNMDQVMRTVVQTIMKKELLLKQQGQKGEQTKPLPSDQVDQVDQADQEV